MCVTLINLQMCCFKLLLLSHIDVAIVWSTQIALDALIFLLTLIQSLRIRKEGSRNIIDILLRDGVSFELALLLSLT